MSTLSLTVDALGATNLGQYGDHRETMPALDRLAEDGTQFTDAYANTACTRLSIPSFHTSRHRGYELIGETPTIASMLNDAGIHTRHRNVSLDEVDEERLAALGYMEV